MSAAGWGTAVTLWLGPASGMVAVLVRAAGKRQAAGYCVFTGLILVFPINLWFWQFGLTERGVPGWYIFSAVIQAIAAMVVLVLSCFVKFRPVVTALVMGYVFSLVLQLFSYL